MSSPAAESFREPDAAAPSTETLCTTKCRSCEGGVPMLERETAESYRLATPSWSLDEAAKMITRKIDCQNFVQAMKLLNDVAQVAESEQHHPDLHLTGYRSVRIDLTTHAIGGLSENDFIVAAKIDQLLD